MKILYAVQATGNGHVSRAMDIIPLLQKKADVDILLSGSQADLLLPFFVKYRFQGLSFIFGKEGGVDLWQTYKKSNLKNLFSEINRLPVEQYDLVINDFEPVSAWACYLKSKDCIALSHQAAVLNKYAPRPEKKDLMGKSILKNYAPATVKYGFHFRSYDKNIFTPVIRSEIRKLTPERKGHYTVYLPAYSDKRIIEVLSECDNVKWEIFSKHSKEEYQLKNIFVFPISAAFVKSMAAAEGILCGAGFETPAEALYMKKKLLVIPMKTQYEQQCNAAALSSLGIQVIPSLKKKYIAVINSWLSSGPRISVDYPDQTEEIIDHILDLHYYTNHNPHIQPGKKAYSLEEFRKLTLKKILLQLAG